MTEAAARSETSSGVTVARWRRFGHDRLYVKDAAGADLGFWDLATGQPHPTDAQWLTAIVGAVDDWRAQVVEVRAERASKPPPAPPPVVEVRTERASNPPLPSERPWVDLATNLPGEAVRERAVEARAARPVRTVLARVLDLKTEERSWRLGAVGEVKVGKQLAKLTRQDPRWRVLHSIPVGSRGSDIDHLLIGPGGVFTVNAKHHPEKVVKVCGNTVYVDGHPTSYVRNSRFESDRASRLLATACGFPVSVEGLIVTVNVAKVVVKNQPAGVHVVPRMQVAGWLQRLGPSLDRETIAALYDAARRGTTWT